MRFGSLFSGIGGLDLGLERAGMTCAWQVEIDEWCRRVLARHWPDVPRWADARTFPPVADTSSEQDRGVLEPWLAPDALAVDLVCGGFPCQPVSLAGKRRGQDDERWLWPEFARIVRLLRPRYVLVENVPGLLARGMGDVLGDLAASGYDAEWDCIPAAAVGAPHLRYRVFIVAHANGQGVRDEPVPESGGSGSAEPQHDRQDADSDGRGREGEWISGLLDEIGAALGDDADGRGGAVPHADEFGWDGWTGIFGQGRRPQPEDGGWWATEPDVGRVAHGIPSRVDRLRGLGNAVVPQVAEWIGRRLMEAAA